MKINWKKIRGEFEKEMALKFQGLPDHRKVPEDLKEFRHLISHQLPETAPRQVFRHLIGLLLKEKPVDLQGIKKQYLNPLLEKENELLSKFEKEFNELKQSAEKWVKTNLPEEELKLLWKKHKTWLPRRYTIYSDKRTSFQKIAADTLARYALIKRSNLVK